MDKKDKPVHILVIRLSALGDVAMMVPVLQALHLKYPDIRTTILTKKAFAPIFAEVEKVEVVVAKVKREHKGFQGLWRLYRELKKREIDAVADLHNVLRSKILKKYFSLSRTPFFQIDKGRKEKKALTRTNNKDFKQLKTTHERYAEVFHALGFPLDLGAATPLQRQPLSKEILNLIGQNTQKWIGIAPFAAHKGKMYPLERMEEVIQNLNDTEKYKILLYGGGERESKYLENLSRHYANTLNLAGKLALKDELKVISNLDVMISMDSGNAHLAANYGIPVVTLWGVTHPYAGFYPFGQPLGNALLPNRDRYPLIPTSIYGNKVPPGYEKVMETITPQSVVEKIHKVLAN